MTTENDDLIKRLRTYAPNNITRRAADMFEALQAERDALQAKLNSITGVGDV